MNDNINNKRNIIIATTAIVLALILAVIGVSYAFFSLQVNGEDTTTKIEISTGEAGGITLSGKVENFHISVDAKDMAYKNLGDYYATDNQDKNYADSKEEGIKDLGRIDINGILSETQTCSATIKLEFTTSIKDQIQEGDFTLGLIYGEEEQEIDLKNISTSGTTIKFKLDGQTATPTYIKAYLKLNNADRDQSYLADQEMKVKISVDSFVCKELKGLPPLEALQSKPGFIEKSGMYRFVGDASTVTDNYICFGTDDTDECLGAPKTYMYRIIGLTNKDDNEIGLQEGQLKIIRAVPTSQSKAWHSDSSPDVPWDSSTMFTYLNEDFLDTIKNGLNGTYWDKLITIQNWYIQDQPSTPGATEEPTGKKTTNPGKIGLMYGTDYINAYMASTSNWLHVTHGLSSSSTYSSLNEWTMTRYGIYPGGFYDAWAVFHDGGLFWGYGVSVGYAFRPVFYLTPDILLSGEGKEDNPFIILEA